MNNNSPKNPRISIGMASGRKLPPDFYQNQPVRGKMGGLQPMTMVDAMALENAWRNDLTLSSDNIIRNARLCE